MKKLFCFFLLFIFLTVVPSYKDTLAKHNEENTLKTSRLSQTDSRRNMRPIRQNTALNSVDSFTNIVLFVRFSDESTYTSPFSLLEYETIFNGTNQASLRDYFLEVSYDQLTINSHLLSENNEIYYIDDTNPRNFYRPFNEISNPIGYQDDTEWQLREHELIKRTIDYVENNQLIDPTITLDTNGDNIVDSVTFMMSGEDDGWNSLFWPHRWQLSTYYDYELNSFKDDAPTLNGFNVYDYTFELMGHTRDYQYRADVGILAHETFHLLSATDLYHYYDYTYIDNVGHWGLMDQTSTIPSHMLGYMKETYGSWISNVDEITTPGSYTLYPLQDSENNLYRIPTGHSNEYIYLEYRNQAGKYEANLEDSGLIVYRVDLDNEGYGNRDGYYLEDNTSSNEVFVFRPGIFDTQEPIEFPQNPENTDFDGDISLAALSSNNLYDSAGGDSDIMMFHSDGSLIDIEIINVVEHNGYVTFDVLFARPTIDLVVDETIDAYSDILLWDSTSMNYAAEVNGLGDFQAYYTLDGSAPSISSNIYNGPISFDASTNHIRVAVYQGSDFLYTIDEMYTFTDTLATNHDGYGNNQSLTYVLHPHDLITNTRLTFSGDSYVEYDYDFITVTAETQSTVYTGSELANVSLSDITSTILIHLESDESISDGFGFSATFDYEEIQVFHMNGEATINLPLEEDYIDASGYIDLAYDTLYSFETSGSIDNSILGEQYIIYSVYNLEGDVVQTYIRTVNVVDTTPPTISLNGEPTLSIEVFEDYIDPGVSVFDNYDTSIDYTVEETIDIQTIGTYIVTYTATDSSGNTTTVTRTVVVKDSTPPHVELVGDSEVILDVFTSYEEDGLIMTDNYDDNEKLSYTTTSDLDMTTLGTYTIQYMVSDSSGNEQIITRTIIVVDHEPPNVFLNPSIDTVYVGEPHSDNGVQATDNYDETLTIETLSTLDNNKVGTYTITYHVSDSSGNTTILTRYLTVLPKDEPILFEFSEGRVAYYQNEPLTLPTCTVNGQTCGVDETTIDNETAGIYVITYSVTIDGQTYDYDIPITIYENTTTPVVFYEKKRGIFL